MFWELYGQRLLGPSMVLVALVLPGCGGGDSGSESTGLDLESVRARSNVYNLFLAKNRFQPPKDEAAFRQFLSSQQGSLEKSGLTIDEMFVSPRNGETLQWVYGKRLPTAGGISVFAYETKAVDGQRLLLGDRGAYITVNDAEFKKAFPDAR